MEQEEIIEHLLEICVDEARKNRLRNQVDLQNIVFTLDNFMKIVLIHLRLRANMPVILMGETGVGKTSLVEYLAKIIDAECKTLNVHAGVTEEEIVAHVKKAQDLARNQSLIGPPDRREKRKVIIFFDEINTNTNISGLLKEIFVDRHIQGERFEANVCLVAACNPTKFRKSE